MSHFSGRLSMLGSLRRTSSSVLRCPISSLRSVGVQESTGNGSGKRGVVTLRSPGATINLFAHILGDSPASEHAFSVTVKASDFVDTLRKEVYIAKQNRFKGIDASDLVLWKFKNPVPVGKVDEAVADLGDLSAVADKMYPFHDILNHFPTTPSQEHLHIIVQARSLPSAGQRHGLFDDETDGSALRVGMQKKRRLDLKLLEGSKTIYMSESNADSLSEPHVLPTSSTFDHLVSTPNIVAADRTAYIEELDQSLQYQLVFLRPRGWGKTTLLQMLANYYDLNKAREFDNTFGHLYIGKNPTPDRSSFLVLVFDFSGISTADRNEAEKALSDTILHTLRKFLETNKRFLGYPNSESLLGDNGTRALGRVLNLVQQHKRKLFLGVDEYDAPANACLLSEKVENYDEISGHFQGRFFAIIKREIGFSIHKYWITGVLPAFKDGFSSLPLLATTDISTSPQYHNVCGLTENEVRAIAKAYLVSTHDEAELDQELGTMKRWFSGQRFHPSGYGVDVPSLYTPRQVFTHLRTVSRKAGQVHSDEELDATNIASVLNAIKDDQGMNIYDLLRLLSGNVQGRIMGSFGVEELKSIGKRADITWTFLYYFGVITRGHEKRLVIPNLTMRYLIMRRVWEYLNTVDPAFTTRMKNSCAVFANGNHSPLVGVLEEFFRRCSERSIYNPNTINLQSLMEICWFEDDRCLRGLRLVADPAKANSKDCFGLIDFFIASSPESHGSSAALIVLRQVTLIGLCKALGVDASKHPSKEAMESLQMELKEEEPSQLLKRSYCYWDNGRREWHRSSVSELLREATQTVNNYLSIAKNGSVKGTHGGILDERIICETGEDWLVGHVMICIGDTRVITLQVGKEKTRYSFRKASTKPEFLT